MTFSSPSSPLEDLHQDIPAIMQTGVTGIAVSGAILNAENPVEEMRLFISATDNDM